MANKVWRSKSASFDLAGGGVEFTFNDTGAPVPGTLLRSLIWVSWAGYIAYETGEHGVPFGPVGYGFSDLNSQNNFDPWSPADNGFEIDKDLIAFDQITPTPTGLGWPPVVSGTLSGSINEIDSSGDIELTENINAFMYATGTSFVDSHAQRLFSEEPQYGFATQTSVGPDLRNGAYRLLFTWRGLYLPR